MGAWIETSTNSGFDSIKTPSHPTWVRGLKHLNYPDRKLPVGVAPYMGAWIETRICSCFSF